MSKAREESICLLFTVYLDLAWRTRIMRISLGASLTLRTGKRDELRVKSKEAVRLVWLASATARLAARLTRLEIAGIEKYFSNPCNHHILSALRDFSRVSIYHSLSLFITLYHSAAV